MLSKLAAVGLFASSILAQSCDDLGTADYLVESGKGKEYVSQQGWYQGRRTWYWEFGDRSQSLSGGAEVGVAPIWVLNYEEGGSAGKNVIDVLPCETGYSDLWEVVNVTVLSTDVAQDSLTSRELIEAAVDDGNARFEVAETPTYVNCPVVPFGSTITDASTTDNPTLPGEVTGWYQEQPVFYYDFGGVQGTDTEPVWIVNKQNGESAGLNLIDTIPGDSDYTPFWQMVVVTVPNDTANNSIRNADQINTLESSGDATVEDMEAIVNCPVSFTETNPVGDNEDVVVSGNNATAGASTVTLSVAAGLVAVAAIVA